MKLIVLQGLPGSGKTTWRKKYLEDHPGTVAVCRDEIRNELGDYSHTRKVEEEVSKIEISRVKTALGEGIDVIIDATNLNDKTVSMWKGIAKQYGIEPEFVKMDYIPMAEAIRRDVNDDRDHHVGKKKIEEFYYRYYPEKYFEEKNEAGKTRHIFIWHERIPVDDSLPRAVICDIDGTLGWMDRSPFDYEHVDEDRVDERMVQILRAMDDAGVTVIIMSGREATDVCVEKTKKWLDSAINGIDYQLIMRDKMDYRPDNVVKKELYERHIKGIYDVMCVYEDRDKVVDMWREMGILCCQVAKSE